jgi:hypothetical protein
MAYQEGDKCIECGRSVVRFDCSVCSGTGKSKGDWVWDIFGLDVTKSRKENK